VPQSLEQEIRTLQSILWSERDPQGRAFAPLADAYLRAGEIKKALDLLTNGMSRHPAFASGHVVATRLYLQQGMHSEAQFAARRALELDGENVVALAALAEALEGVGESDEASRVRATLAQLDPDFDPDEVALAVAQATNPLESTSGGVPRVDAVPGSGGAALVGEAAGDVAAPASEVEPQLAEEETPGAFAELEAREGEAEEPDARTESEPAGDALDAIPGLASLELVPEGEIAEPPASAREEGEESSDLESVVIEPPVDIATLAPEERAEEVVDVGALAPEEPAKEVVDVGTLAPEGSADEVVDVGALAPEERAEEVVDVGALAPDEPAKDVVDVGALAPEEPAKEVVDVGTLAPEESAEEVVDVGALAPEESAEEVTDVGALASEEPSEEAVDVAALAPDLAVDVAVLAPDEPAEVPVEVGALAPQEHEEEIVDLVELAPDEPPEPAVDPATLAPDPLAEGPMDVDSLAPDEPLGQAGDLAALVHELALTGGAVDVGMLAPDSKPTTSGPAEPIYTRTLAELYVRQGVVDKALDVLRHLLEQDPEAGHIRRRIAELEGGDLEPSPEFAAPSPTPADEPEEEETETLARDLAESGAEGHDVDTPFAWTESEADEPSEEAGPPIGDYFDRLLAWQPRKGP
jgi:hypothetical protein